MDNSYFLLCGSHYGVLRNSLEELYGLRLEGLYGDVRFERGNGGEISRDLLRCMDVVVGEGWGEDSVSKLVEFVVRNRLGLELFSRVYRWLESRWFPSRVLVSYSYGGGYRFGHGMSTGSNWSEVVWKASKESDVYCSGFGGVSVESIYEMVVDYVYYYLCHFMDYGCYEEMLRDYRGVRFVEGFDAVIACMFLRYYEWLVGDRDGGGACVVSLLRAYRREGEGSGFEVFKEGLKGYVRERGIGSVDEYIRGLEFRSEFIRGNSYGLEELLRGGGVRGEKDWDYLRAWYYGGIRSGGKGLRVDRDLRLIGRFVEYVLSHCYLV